MTANGNCKALSKKRRFNMSRHIVSTFKNMDKKSSCFRNQIIHKRLKILSNPRIGIFIYYNSSRSMLQHNIHQAILG